MLDWFTRHLPSRDARASSFMGFDAGGDMVVVSRTAYDAAVAKFTSLYLSGAGAPVDYTDGTPPATGEGVALPGALYTDTTGGTVYRNSGSQAEPAWTALADAA